MSTEQGDLRAGAPPSARVDGARRRSGRTALTLVGVVTAVVLVLVVAAVLGDGDDDRTATTDPADLATTGTVVASGPPLPADTGRADDPAVGMAVPTLTGTDQAGAPMTIGDGERPTLVVFVAHWCRPCREAVPVVQSWVDSGGLPRGVDLAAVSTAIDPTAPNFPPYAWLNRVGWTTPVLVDADGTAADAVGLSTLPYVVAIDTDGAVVARAAGELDPAQLEELAAALG
jgi:thiol-disulfide isomerase/thioredoxin